MSERSNHLIIATAGHIDHGKTSLVRALTGMETDRLEDEKRRGITIELGFAFLGDNITIIDVPGHERFVKTMVAGVSTVDLALLVVAADDGMMPQTSEHLAILHLLGVPRLIVVLSKINGQERDWLDLLEEEIRDQIPAIYQESLKVFRCDSKSGEGIPELKQELVTTAESVQPRLASEVFRLPVDRAFNMKGYGTVVTGTIIGGSVKMGNKLQLFPAESEFRVRGLQCHGQPRKEMWTGERAAINLIGTDTDAITRGNWLCRQTFYRMTEVIDVEITTLKDAPILKNRDRIRLHIGTDEIIGRLVLIGKDEVQPGDNGFAQFIGEKPLLATRSDRFVFRRYSPVQTWGGGRVLDPIPQRKRRTRPASLQSFSMLSDPETGIGLKEKIKIEGGSGLAWTDARTFTNLAEESLENLILELEADGQILIIGSGENRRLFDKVILEFITEKILEVVKSYHNKHPEFLGIQKASLVNELATTYVIELINRALDEMPADLLIFEQGSYRLKNHDIQVGKDTEEQLLRVESFLQQAELTPPNTAAMGKALKVTEIELNRYLQILGQQKRIIRTSDGTAWSIDVVQNIWNKVKSRLQEKHGRSASELRELMGCPRRYAIKLLEYFDQRGLLDRREDLRYPGKNFEQKI